MIRRLRKLSIESGFKEEDGNVADDSEGEDDDEGEDIDPDAMENEKMMEGGELNNQI